MATTERTVSFTEGEWVGGPDHIDPYIIGPMRALQEKGGTIVPQHQAVCRVMNRSGETDGNIRLIAAAPNLREACLLFTQAAHEVRDLLNDRGLACPASIALAAEKARHALAKADGA